MVERARVHGWLAVLAGVLGALALAAGDPYPRNRDTSAGASYVTPVEVARWIRDPRPGLHVVDVRAESAFAAYHIPGAEHVPLLELSRLEWPRDAVLVLYAEDDSHVDDAAQLLRRRGADTVHVVRGGLLAWIDQIVQPRFAALAPTATPAEQAARREHLELSRYFGGTPFVSPTVEATPRFSPSGARAQEAAAVARILRRGC